MRTYIGSSYPLIFTYRTLLTRQSVFSALLGIVSATLPFREKGKHPNLRRVVVIKCCFCFCRNNITNFESRHNVPYMCYIFLKTYMCYVLPVRPLAIHVINCRLELLLQMIFMVRPLTVLLFSAFCFTWMLGDGYMACLCPCEE